MEVISSTLQVVAPYAQLVANAMEIPDVYIAKFGELTWAIFGPGALAFEEALTTVAPSAVAFFDSALKEYSIPTRMPLPLMHRPTDILFAIVLYFVALAALFVVAKILGKGNYRFLGLIHNFFLFALSLYMGVAILATALCSNFPRLWNNPIVDNRVDDNGWRLAKLGWVFLLSKLPEYGDTFLMVLKHNHRQISFLHLYHHSSIFVWSFCIVAGGCGGDIYWPSMVNSWVHVAMYGYYAGTLAFKDGPIRRALNSIKFIITKGQITQFVLNMAQASFVLLSPVPYFPRFLAGGQIVYMVTMVALFSNFLLRNQGKKVSAKDGAKASKESKKQK